MMFSLQGALSRSTQTGGISLSPTLTHCSMSPTRLVSLGMRMSTANRWVVVQTLVMTGLV